MIIAPDSYAPAPLDQHTENLILLEKINWPTAFVRSDKHKLKNIRNTYYATLISRLHTFRLADPKRTLTASPQLVYDLTSARRNIFEILIISLIFHAWTRTDQPSWHSTLQLQRGCVRTQLTCIVICTRQIYQT